MSDKKGENLIGLERKCLFCEIVSGQKEEEIVYQDDKFIVFPAKDLSAPVHLLLALKHQGIARQGKGRNPGPYLCTSARCGGKDGS